jgi:hypothetical protein
MILDGKDGKLRVGQPFDTSVREIDVADVEAGSGRNGSGVDLEVVVLRGDGDDAGALLTHGVVRAVMPEGQAAGTRSRRQSQNLMPEADAQEWYLLLPYQRSSQLDEIGDALRVAWPIGEDDALQIEAANRGEIDSGRRDENPQSALGQAAGDALFEAGIDQQDSRRVGR